MATGIKERVVRKLEGIKEGREVKDIFVHKGRTCVVMEMHFGTSIVGSHHNGYVETILEKVTNKTYDKYCSKIDTDELTFSGELPIKKLKGKKFFGFDSGHFWNTQNPQSQTRYAVKKKTIKLCEEMVKKGI